MVSNSFSVTWWPLLRSPLLTTTASIGFALISQARIEPRGLPVPTIQDVALIRRRCSAYWDVRERILAGFCQVDENPSPGHTAIVQSGRVACSLQYAPVPGKPDRSTQRQFGSSVHWASLQRAVSDAGSAQQPQRHVGRESVFCASIQR